MKAIPETVEAMAIATADFDALRTEFTVLPDFVAPEGGLHCRMQDLPGLAIEERPDAKVDAVRAFALADPIDRIVADVSSAKFGIVTCGKAHVDVLEALRWLELPLDTRAAADVRLCKVGQVFPIGPQRMHALARGLDEVLVVEEKAPVVENQIRAQLYNLDPGARPLVLGREDADSDWLLPATGEFRPPRVMPVLARWLAWHAPGLDRRGSVPVFGAAPVPHFTGFGQEGGTAIVFARMAGRPALLHQTRSDTQQAGAMIAFDRVVDASVAALQTLTRGRTRVAAKLHENPTAARPDALQVMPGADASGRDDPYVDANIDRERRRPTIYQDGEYEQRGLDLVASVRDAERVVVGPDAPLEPTRQVALNTAKLLAWEDEYEVERAYPGGSLDRALHTAFAGDFVVRYCFAPKYLVRPRADGRPARKLVFGRWRRPGLRLPGTARRLRGAPPNSFGRSAARRTECVPAAGYAAAVSRSRHPLGARTHAAAVRRKALPGDARGFGSVKRAAAERMRARVREQAERLLTAAPEAHR